MPLSDDDPKKWVLKEHTEVKHRILRKYLTTWTRILSSASRKIHFFDGFAGRATYEDEIRGSPILALDVADKNAESFKTFHCTFNEYDQNNYENLSEVLGKYIGSLESEADIVGEEKTISRNTPDISIDLRNGQFEDVALDVMRSKTYRDLPSLVFIDPFGYGGVPFNLVDKIMNLQSRGNEVFFTFMVDTVRRFLSDVEKEEAISELLGTNDWSYIKELSTREEKEEEILKLYREQLQKIADVDYVFPFQMMHPEKETTVYYLIHATNHFKGFKVMKDVMFREGAEDQFAYLGADHYGYEDSQTTLFESTESEDTRVKALAEFLYDRYEDEQFRFWEILKGTYMETDLIEKHYKRAIDILVDEDKATVHNFPQRDQGSKRGKNPDDEIEFCQKNQRLSDFS